MFQSRHTHWERLQTKKFSIQAGLEPTIFCSVGRRVIHCATGPSYQGSMPGLTSFSSQAVGYWLCPASSIVWCFRSVVVITCASHAQGPRFEPGRKQNKVKIFAATPRAEIILLVIQAEPTRPVGQRWMTLPPIRICSYTSVS